MNTRTTLYVAWITAIMATLGSLYFSEVRHLTPCVLCWYQRIAMYPLVIILGVGILRKDRHLPYLVLPLSIIGMIIAMYHYLLQRGIIPDSLAPCQAGISCTTKLVEYFGFVTIPFLSFCAFTLISLCLYMVIRKDARE